MLFRTTKEIGDWGERYAARYLRRHGYRISDRNYRHGKYEIDVIAVGLRDILFVEVKTRTYRPEAFLPFSVLFPLVKQLDLLRLNQPFLLFDCLLSLWQLPL